MRIRAREGDLLETTDSVLFDVKGLVHPPSRIIAFPRYIPDPKGDRKRDGTTYRKIYALSQRYAMLKERFPQYLVHDSVFDETLCEVPVSAIRHHYKPVDHLGELLKRRDGLDNIEAQALRLAKLLKENADVPWTAMGISGSVLVQLHTATSDIDPIVYGTENCYKVYSTLAHLLTHRRGLIKSYSMKELKELFDFRSKDTTMRLEDFIRTDSRKILQGKFMGRDYFIRCVKQWNELEERYGALRYRSVGHAKIRARVVNDSDAIFTPCCYRIDEVQALDASRVQPIEEIVSFRGRFCEQAKSGELVIAQGKVEEVQREGERGHFRLLLGNNVSDHMILV